jgi:hypothetical protein
VLCGVAVLVRVWTAVWWAIMAESSALRLCDGPPSVAVG